MRSDTAVSAEQVDALALTIFNDEKSAATILGDQFVAGHTRMYDPVRGCYTTIKELAEAGGPIHVLSMTPQGLVREGQAKGCVWGTLADLLNERGLLTARGKEWSNTNLRLYCQRNAIVEVER